MKILGLDISTKTGWALFQDAQLVSYGVIKLHQNICNFANSEYPWNYNEATEFQADNLLKKVQEVNPDVIVIEETNSSRARYSQKALEYLHKALLNKLTSLEPRPKVVYINTSTWRKILNIRLSDQDKKNNSLINKGFKKKLGLKGKITRKHLSVRWVNEFYGLSLLIGENDVADAITLTTAYIRNAPICDGKM